MKSFLEDVRNQRQLKALIGLSRAAFDKLLEAFSLCLEQTKGEEYRKNMKRSKKADQEVDVKDYWGPQRTSYFLYCIT